MDLMEYWSRKLKVEGTDQGALVVYVDSVFLGGPTIIYSRNPGYHVYSPDEHKYVPAESVMQKFDERYDAPVEQEDIGGEMFYVSVFYRLPPGHYDVYEGANPDESDLRHRRFTAAWIDAGKVTIRRFDIWDY